MSDRHGTRQSKAEARDGARDGPLTAIRVLELGNMIAAPYGGKLLATFGAEVIKVEQPRVGDELRRWRLFQGQTSMWWYVQGRNKKSITLDLRQPKGQELALELIRRSDVVLENFRPGTLEKWNLGYEAMQKANPDVILVRISGYGQTGPYRDRRGFGGVAEAVGGIRNLTGYPDRPPTRVGVSLGDSLGGMFGVIGALMALLHGERARRERRPAGDGGGFGQVVDVALYEAVFDLLESTLPEYDAYGIIRERIGNELPGVAPSNTYPCGDEQWVVIGGNADAVFVRLMRAIGRPDLAEDPRLRDNPGRAKYHEFLDEVITGWTLARTLQDVMDVMIEAGVPAGPIYDAPAIASDPHYAARQMLEAHEVAIGAGERKTVRFPGVVPKLTGTPGAIRWLGPELGAHNDEVYRGLLQLSPQQIDALKREGVI